MFCGFAIRSRESVMYYGLGDYKSPGLIGRTFFYDGLQIRRDAWRGMGRLAVCMGRLARGDFRAQKKVVES